MIGTPPLAKVPSPRRAPRRRGRWTAGARLRPASIELDSQTIARRDGSAYGRGRSSTPSTTVNTAAAAPIPRPSVSTAASVNPAFVRRDRTAYRRSMARPRAPLAAAALARSRAALIATLGLDGRDVAELAPSLAPGASSVGMPCSISSCARMSRWNRISSPTSRRASGWVSLSRKVCFMTVSSRQGRGARVRRGKAAAGDRVVRQS